MSRGRASQDREEQVLANEKKVDRERIIPGFERGYKGVGNQVTEGPIQSQAEHAPTLRDPRVARIDRQGVHGLSLSEGDFFCLGGARM